MIVWLNGTFGVGKTTTANALLDASDDWRMFDPEHVGYLVAGNLRDLDFDDFQELQPWRTLVPVVAAELFRFTNPPVMVAVQTVLVEDHWHELMAGFAAQQLRVAHVLLHSEESELRRRIEMDENEPGARDWRVDHLARYESARSWLTAAADLQIDTTEVPPEEVASSIIDTFT